MNTRALPRLHSLWRILAVTSSILAVAFISTQPQVSNDFWLQAKIGELIVANGAIPRTLLFPFTEAANFSFNAHEWLPSVVFHFVIQVFGEAGLPLILGFLGVLLFLFTSYLASKRAGGRLSIGLLFGLFAMIVENYRHFLRPELLAVFFFLAFLECLEQLRTRISSSGFISAVCITVLWANSHGSFVLAPALTVVYLIGTWLDGMRNFSPRTPMVPTPTRYFLALAIAVSIGTLLNPFGIELLKFVWSYSGTTMSRKLITEWFPTFDPRLIHTPAVWVGVLAGLGVALTCIRFWREMSMVDILASLMFLTLGFSAFRFLLYIGFVSALVIPSALSSLGRSPLADRKILLCTTALSVLILGLAIRFGNMNGNLPYQSDFSEILSEPMKKTLASPDIRGNVYNSYDLGAEIVYRDYPRLRPSIDSRIDSYGDDYFIYHESLLKNSASMSAFVKKYDVTYMLLTREDFRTVLLHKSLPGSTWSLLMLDNKAALLQRSD